MTDRILVLHDIVRGYFLEELGNWMGRSQEYDLKYLNDITKYCG